MKNPLPQLIARITGKPRYVPAPEWSGGKLFVHDAFRILEQIFGKKGQYDEKGNVQMIIEPQAKVDVFYEKGEIVRITRAFYSIEAVLAYAESVVRGYMPVPKIGWIQVPILQPAFAGMGGAPRDERLIPYLFITFDAHLRHPSSSYSLSSGFTVSFTTSGSNRALFAGINMGGASITSLYSSLAATYNGVSLVQKGNLKADQRGCAIFGLAAPATGANNYGSTWGSGGSEMSVSLISYNGVDQTTPSEAEAETNWTTSAATQIYQDITTLTANAWVFCTCFTRNLSGTLTVDSPSTTRMTPDGASWSADRTTTTTGVYRVSGTTTGTIGSGSSIIMSVAIKPGSTTTNQAVDATTSVSASMLTPKTIVSTISATTAASASVATSIGKLLSATATATASVLKGLAMEISAEVSITATTLAQRAYLVAMNAAVAVSATTQTAIAKVLEATSTVSASITKTFSVSQLVSATASITSTIEAGREKLLEATTAITASITTAIGKTLTADVSIIARLLAPFYKTKYPAHGDGDEYEVKYPHDTI